MRALFLAALLVVQAAAFAVIEPREFDDPAKQQLYDELIEELRCLVCQNQNLAASNADLAKDLREQTYEMIQQGATKQEILDFMTDRYGDFVLYRPPVKPTTWLLWAGPGLLLGVGLAVVVVVARRRAAAADVDGSEREKARRLLED